MRIALLTTDNREHLRTYSETQPRFGPAIEAVLQGLEERPNLEIHVISCTQQPMHAPNKLTGNAWFHLLPVPKIGWMRTGYQGCVRAIRRKLRTLRPDVVHGQGTERECALSAAFSGFPNVITIHGNMSEVAKSFGAPFGSFLWCAAHLEAFALRRVGGVLCNSAHTESLVRRYASHTWRMPNAVRRAFFDTPLTVRPASGKPILLSVGSIIALKRPLELLTLAEKLHQEGHSFELHFIGAANPRNRYADTFLRRIEAAEGHGFARYRGTLTLAELILAMDHSSALIHTPMEEAFGLVVAEALARNLKFFGTRVGGLPEITDGVEGAELFALNDEQSLVSAIGQWLHRGCARPRNGAQQMRLRYHPDVIAKGHAEIYAEVLRTFRLPTMDE